MIADGPPSRGLEQAIDGRIELVLPDLVLNELRRVLVEKLGFDDAHAREARNLLVHLAIAQPEKPQQVVSITGDRDDDAILTSAVEAGADVLVTGDKKHLSHSASTAASIAHTTGPARRASSTRLVTP